VRGDSLRDFYAKTLAVLGLGVLAATGAAVDYWPVGEVWPAVPAVAGLLPDGPVPAPPLPADVLTSPRAPRRTPPPSFVSVNARLDASFAGTAPDVALEPAPLPESFLAVDTPLPEPSGVVAMDLEPAPIVLVGAPPEDSRRLFGDAVRRTRESFAAARLFFSEKLNGMGEKISGVVGAFRKVSPFFAAGVVAPAQ
jgi:hypothetical protein